MLQNLSKGAMQAGVAVDISRQLECALEALGATGKGLHEKASSIEGRLPEALVTKLHFIASVRNKIVHEDELLPDGDISILIESGKLVMDALEALDDGKRAKSRQRAKAGRKATRRQARPSEKITPAQTVETIRLAGVLFLAGTVLVFVLMLLGNDGLVLWIGSFSIFSLLGWYFLRKLRRISAFPGHSGGHLR